MWGNVRCRRRWTGRWKHVNYVIVKHSYNPHVANRRTKATLAFALGQGGARETESVQTAPSTSI